MLLAQFRWSGVINALLKRNITIGIRKEDINRWEMRTPLVPVNVAELTKINKVKVIVQPCTKRIFTDGEFEKVVPYSFVNHCFTLYSLVQKYQQTYQAVILFWESKRYRMI
jgi:hypothetical protein